MMNVYVCFVTLVVLLYWLWLTLGQDIRRWRLARGLTQEGLAELVDVQPRSVQRWEADECCPRPGHLYQMGLVKESRIVYTSKLDYTTLTDPIFAGLSPETFERLCRKLMSMGGFSVPENKDTPVATKTKEGIIFI